MSSRMKHLVVSLAATAALFAGAPGPAGAQQVTLDGSTGMLLLANELVRAFEVKHPSVPIEVGRGSSSSSAMRAVADGRISIGLSSDPPGEAARAAGLQGIEIARAAVVFAVHASVTIPGLSTQQVCDIYARKIKNWKEVGGPDLFILPLSRPADEFDPKIIKKHYPCFREAEGVLILPKAGHMAKALESKAGAIGMINSSYVENSRGATRALILNGAAATPENIRSGEYPLIRRFFLVTRGAPGGSVAQFVAFVKSPDGERVIRNTNTVPVQ